MEVGGQLRAPAALPPQKNPCIQRTEGWVGPKAGPDALEKTKIQQPSCYTEYAVLAPSKPCKPTFSNNKLFGF